jgi:hypothetical protein
MPETPLKETRGLTTQNRVPSTISFSALFSILAVTTMWE